MIQIDGVEISPETQCKHYPSNLDVVAIRLPCCKTYYSCIFCHEELSGHNVVKWNKSQIEEEAVFCGICKSTISIADYVSGDNHCPKCNAKFNPKCKDHCYFYFDWLD